MPKIDMYSFLPPERGRQLRLYNKERLAVLTASHKERKKRLDKAAQARRKEINK